MSYFLKKSWRFVAVFAVVWGLIGFTGCQPQQPPAFPSVHQPPRTFVHHTPLWPKAGESVKISALLEPGEEAGTRGLRILVYGGSTDLPMVTQECPRQGLSVGFQCEMDVEIPSDSQQIAYRAEIIMGEGEPVQTPLFTFDVRPDNSGADRIFALRAPLLHSDGAFKVVMVRACGDRGNLDCGIQYPEPTFLVDLETAIYDHLLRDPTLRWRSEQIAWYYYGAVGQVAGARSGLTARCGSDPWPSNLPEVRLPEVVRGADALGVIHRSGGVDEFRDCASQHVASLDVGSKPLATFSADGRSPQTIQHELGHVLFGLGEEYTESEEDRRFPGGGTPTGDCSCCDPTTDGPQDPNCTSENSCSNPLPASCFPAPEVCPPLTGTCGNLFLDEESCQRFASRIDRNPWIESPVGSCRILCGGPGAEACPCQPAGELWVLDEKNPPSGESDVMGTSEGGDAETFLSFFGPACTACTELAFCLRWRMGVMGHTEEDARLFCEPGRLVLGPPEG